MGPYVLVGSLKEKLMINGENKPLIQKYGASRVFVFSSIHSITLQHSVLTSNKTQSVSVIKGHLVSAVYSENRMKLINTISGKM
jgi:hypothetical protein